jgi:hypothetical protein
MYFSFLLFFFPQFFGLDSMLITLAKHFYIVSYNHIFKKKKITFKLLGGPFFKIKNKKSYLLMIKRLILHLLKKKKKKKKKIDFFYLK